MLLKEIIDKFYIEEVKDIYWINEDILSDISLEDFSSNLDNSKYKKYKQEFKHIVDFLNDRNITKN